MTATFTIILPHKRNPRNDDALAICLDCLARNTVNDFALIMDACEDEPIYPRVNAMMDTVYTDCMVYWASDMFAAPGWDVPMLELWSADPLNTLVTNIVVEPGVIAMHGQNLHRDFGRLPETFNRAAFEAWAQNEAPEMAGEGWFCPYMVDAPSTDCLETDRLSSDGFSDADQRFFERWKAAGKRIVRAQRSYVYHLQRWSDPVEQEAGKRR